jgi:hypothetical protein
MVDNSLHTPSMSEWPTTQEESSRSEVANFLEAGLETVAGKLRPPSATSSRVETIWILYICSVKHLDAADGAGGEHSDGEVEKSGSGLTMSAEIFTLRPGRVCVAIIGEFEDGWNHDETRRGATSFAVLPPNPRSRSKTVFERKLQNPRTI